MRFIWLAMLLGLLLSATHTNAQHCPYDGSIWLVLDVRNAETGAPVPGLKIRLADKDKVPYYFGSWTFAGSTRFPLHSSTEMTFTYITDTTLNDIKKTSPYRLPVSLKHKYALWLGPGVYRNAFYANLQAKKYLKDMAVLGRMDNGIIKRNIYIKFNEKVLWYGCTTSALWQGAPDFQQVFFKPESLLDFEKTKN